MADASLQDSSLNSALHIESPQGDADQRATAERLTTLILAGDDPGAPSPLSFSERVAQKALIEVGSRPMIAWTIDAARHSPRTGPIVVVGLDTPNVDLGVESTSLAGSGNFAQNLLAGLDWAATKYGPRTPVLVLSSDTPLINPEAVTWFVDACGTRENDLHLAIVRQETLEAIYPRNGRSWLKTREGNFTSGELALIRPQALLRNRERLVTLAQKRHDAYAIFRALPGSLQVRTLLGTTHLWEVREAAQQLTGLQIGLIEMPFAAPAIDVDSAQDLAAVRNEMAQLRMLRAN
jgi:GTP:adenosylcobinamide-phosphate guanylyltransferase